MRFILDECVSSHIAKGLAAFGEKVQHITQVVPSGTKDVDWIPALGAEGYFLITEDSHQRRNPTELALLQEHGLGVFFIPGNLGYCPQARLFVRAWPEIKRTAGLMERPFLMQVGAKGQITVLRAKKRKG